ncbi:hypothetical protein QWY92_04120 [Algibacter miyuki]|uniref:hypothetical protein n=1 Tax=Algibacter miyuki TaxID=1306933 RepID=UPI0025B42F97|nr:hypothetical protein [Algibacter miyuki]MDN3664582.1 hypothetical protein [Algibacter miyuki]MDN3664583.1 hypothetical protein [Algibacter miyuki]MDN3664584.1 hypothetical protein [Algibacter miyuki]MDN3664585.1 hypothetical protein [Algibacter miyuki]MDN3664586.1 hypothetical protein [Algibacter miyuki]
MKTLKITFVLALLVVGFTSCTEQDLNDGNVSEDFTDFTGGDIDEVADGEETNLAYFTGGDIDE